MNAPETGRSYFGDEIQSFYSFFSCTVIHPLYSSFELKPTTALQIGSGNRSLSLNANTINIFNDPSSILNGEISQLQAYSKTVFNVSGLKRTHWSTAPFYLGSIHISS